MVNLTEDRLVIYVTYYKYSMSMFRAAVYFLVYHNTNVHYVTIQSMRTPAFFSSRNKYLQRQDYSHV